MTYDKERPSLPAAIRRQVMTEAGHCCTVQHCNESIVEVHHIDENRENNDPSNLIVLCDKHHKLAHKGDISRMDQRKYKEMLTSEKTSTSRGSSEHDRNLLIKINNIISYDTIQLLKNEWFGSFVRKEAIDPLHNLFYQAEDPLFKFTNPKLEAMKIDVLNKGQKFIRHFGQQSAGRIDGYDYIDLNEIKRRDPNADIEYWKKYSEDTMDLAQDFCTAMSLLRAELIHN
ncbi:HNH endonuclease [Vibrio kasasachensis]|uniref:HNH endonuclease signature motif containing protein n=1 Tax=Vibrio kasasachensis TaxID=2910248 RepID=UPI003D124954